MCALNVFDGAFDITSLLVPYVFFDKKELDSRAYVWFGNISNDLP